MYRTTAALFSLTLLATGCAPDGSGFARADGDADELAPAPETEEELTAALFTAVFAPPADGPAEYASVLDLLLDVVVPSANADDSVSDSCAPGQDMGWATTSPSGPSGTFGAAQNAVDVDTDRDYCQDSAGNWNTGNGLYKSVELSGVTATCNWGGEYDLSALGIVRRVGQSANKDISATFSFSGDTDGSADCSLMLTNGSDEDSVHVAGLCSGWTAGFSATPGTSCTVDTKRAE